ncbi:MAG: diguanylate cyclase [Oscillospiraceae bacterium]|nr:diguanylate cyclase [Oscillospiraceae bacterium]
MENKQKNSVLIAGAQNTESINLADVLSDEYAVHSADRGGKVIETASRLLPDIILLDTVMPDIDSFVLLEQLKKSEKTKHIPVILINGLNSDDDVQKGFELGVCDSIEPPFSLSVVKRRLKTRMEIIEHLKTIERLSMMDILTELPNRHSFELRLDTEWRRALRDQSPISIMMVDVDRFSKYNEAYGFQQGDEALREVAKIFTQKLKRAGDFIARWGGEEFVLLLPSTNANGAKAVAEQIRRSIEQMDIPQFNSHEIHPAKLTVSIGVNTRRHENDVTMAEFVLGADMALFSAKNGGRNRAGHYNDYDPTKSDTSQKIVFAVDDNTTNLTMAEEALKGHYRVISLSSAQQMFKALSKFMPDLILLDVEMPEMSGYEAIKRLKTSHLHSEIPVIFLTALSDDKNEAQGIELGAVDFITKPFSKSVLLNRIKNHLQIDELIRERTEQLAERREQLYDKTQQLERLQNSMVHTLADIIENRDYETGGHVDRTSVYMQLLINGMLANDVYIEELKEWDLASIISAARMHDIGKICIPDSILNKPGRLTDEEFDVMKSHALKGADIIDKMMLRCGDVDFLNNAKLIALNHHEKWDGAGYPNGLVGVEIPLHGRIMAVIDVYDALVSERPYKKPFTHEDAVCIIMKDSGRHFDPVIADVFFKIRDEFYASSVKFSGEK